MEASDDCYEEMMALIACESVMDVIDTLEHWVKVASASRRRGLAALPCWWVCHAKHLTAATFYQRFRIWPSVLQRIVCLHEGLPPCELTSQAWATMLEKDSVRDICHALEYLVHGMCMHCGRR